MTTAFWVCATITGISSYVSLGYSVAGLRSTDGPSRTPSLYAFSRSLALAVVTTAAMFRGSEAFLAAFAIAMVVVQALDAGIGVAIKDRLKTFGPAATATANFAAVVWMLRT